MLIKDQFEPEFVQTTSTHTLDVHFGFPVTQLQPASVLQAVLPATQTELVHTFFDATSEQSAVFAQPAHFKLVHAEAEA